MNPRPQIAGGPRFSVIPAGAITDPSIEPRALQVLCLLGRHTDRNGWCGRSQVKMAKELKCGRSTVQRALEQLVDAGYVQVHRAPWDGDEEKQPSASYSYRVILDRDDRITAAPDDGDDAEPEADQTYAESACETVDKSAAADGGVPTSGHPGAQPWMGTGAHTYVGTKERPLLTPPIERERDARARDLTAKNIATLETRWPASASSDRHRVAYAMAALSPVEQEAAIDGVTPFLAELKRLKRSTVPALQTYVEQKRWELLKPAEAVPATPAVYQPDDPEARALRTLHQIAKGEDLFFATVQRKGQVCWHKPITPQLLALADAPERGRWVALTRQQAGAWDELIRRTRNWNTRRPMAEGDVAPWPWPPKVDGTISADGGGAGPPVQPAMSADDDATLAGEGRR